ncbi:MAG: hypothetical protein P4L82_16755 [Ancalomicrobiaceae bacterium]|nr:hypothetical protein [Ancalomicrobiaceae bacterium]
MTEERKPFGEAFYDQIRLTTETGAKFKARLLKLGKRVGWTHCPKCGGRLEASLVGPRNHLHMACQTANCLWMME